MNQPSSSYIVSRETYHLYPFSGLIMSYHVNYPVTNVSRETWDVIYDIYTSNKGFFNELIDKWLWWNASVNLFSRRTEKDELRNHIYHSLFLLNEICFTNENIIDAGTGGGLPGLPMAIGDPANHYTLVDISTKKNLALKNIVRSLGLKNIDAVCCDIKKITFNKSFHIVTKHAFHMSDLLRFVHNYNWKTIHFLKGDDVFMEINGIRGSSFDISIKKIIQPDIDFFKDKYIVSMSKR